MLGSVDAIRDDVPRVTYRSGKREEHVQYGDPSGFAAPSLDLKLVDWDDFLGGALTDYVSLYVKVWGISGPFRRGLPGDCDNTRDDLPNPRHLKTGIMVSPLAALVAVRFFYQRLCIGSASGTSKCRRGRRTGGDDTTTTTFNPETGTYDTVSAGGATYYEPTGQEYEYSFPGFDQSEVGIPLSFQLSFCWRI